MSIKILVSDDNPTWREVVLGDVLKEQGYIVKTAATIDDTLELINRDFFHVVTVDLMFSKDHSIVEGRRTMELLKKLNEGTKAIVLTGHGTVNLAVESLKEFEVYNFLQKGENEFDDEKFLEVVKNAAKEVTVSAVNYKLTVPVQKIIEGYSLHDLSAKLGEKEGEIRWLLLNMTNDYSPIIFSSKHGELSKNEKGYIFTRNLWSRMIGGAITIMLGSSDALQERLSDETNIIYKTTTDKCAGYVLANRTDGFSSYYKG